jgi:hypothetical protein
VKCSEYLFANNSNNYHGSPHFENLSNVHTYICTYIQHDEPVSNSLLNVSPKRPNYKNCHARAEVIIPVP